MSRVFPILMGFVLLSVVSFPRVAVSGGGYALSRLMPELELSFAE